MTTVIEIESTIVAEEKTLTQEDIDAQEAIIALRQDMEACSSVEDPFNTDYRMMRTLGHGHFSEVKLAFHVPTVTCVAVKLLRNKKKYNSIFNSEISVMKSMNHPNIIKLFHVIETEEITYLVMEHASEGELLRRILERGSLPECEAERIFTQVVHAVNYCHNNQVVHRDIKATNILMDCRGNAKLIDFSLAVKVTPGQKLRGFCGTLPYCAPELFARGEYDAYPIDMWCLGILLFLMVAGHFPFQAKSVAGMRNEVTSGNFTIPKHVSIDIFNVILELLIINPGRRPTIKDIMRRPVIRASEARSPPTSTPSLPGTPSPSIVGTMRVIGYKPEVIIESLRDQKYDEVMATYLILQHQSPAGDCGHNQVGSRDSHTDSDHPSLGLEEEDSSSSSSEDLSEMTTVIEIESTIVAEEKTLTQEDIDAQEAIIALRKDQYDRNPGNVTSGLLSKK
ncbi:sperm motility kinase X-like [Meriones unguiculatus]|uniref:sperm motility kinase X-like n=1 Tax=Meriones unguiculatus TaxID=10047 RepID=UPI00293F1AD1|nr:sperm motility kinase X-like [Meriones unguiculatus]